MFSKILHANDGSDPAFNALALALDISKQSFAALHMVCVEEIPHLPEYIEEVREETRLGARRFHSVLQKARGMAEQHGALCEPLSIWRTNWAPISWSSALPAIPSYTNA